MKLGKIHMVRKWGALAIFAGAFAVWSTIHPTTPAMASGVEQAEAKATEVMGIRLSSAKREDVRVAMNATKTPVIREDSLYWYDLYQAAALLDGADQLAIGYSLADGRLGVLRYNFPAFMDTEKVRQVADMVVQKYGRPSRSSGDVNLGAVQYVWNLPDGIILTVARGWPDTSVSLVYEVPSVSKKIAAEMAENEKAEKKNSAKRQSKNF